jgi:hypothetical protein
MHASYNNYLKVSTTSAMKLDDDSPFDVLLTITTRTITFEFFHLQLNASKQLAVVAVVFILFYIKIFISYSFCV